MNADYYAKMLLASCSMPALLKMKPSNLININKRIFWQGDLLKILQSEILKFDCCSFILYEDSNLVNYMVYDKELLGQTLVLPDNRRFLMSYGYQLPEDKISDTLYTLKQRFNIYHDRTDSSVNFPHEIGVILGYPVRDVEDFIRYKGKNYTLNGVWKAYHNTKEAEKKFIEYKIIRNCAIRMVNAGINLIEINEYGRFQN